MSRLFPFLYAPVRLRLIDRRIRWGLTRRGFLVLFALFLMFAAAGVLSVFPFLAVSSPVGSDILVVEGWISIVGAARASEIIRLNGYKSIIVAGGPIAGTGEYNPEYGTYADQGLSRLRRAGVPESRLAAISAFKVDRDRTFAEAMAVKSWFYQQGLLPAKFDVLSEAVHARRTRLLFRKAFGPAGTIGIIALPPSEYPAYPWWRYSAGVKDVITESAAYIYARLFFWP